MSSARRRAERPWPVASQRSSRWCSMSAPATGGRSPDRMRPAASGGIRRSVAHTRAGQASVRGHRRRPSAFDDSLGTARYRQDHAGALIAQRSQARFIALSAVQAGIKDVREAVEQARQAAADGAATVLFLDEVHRFNKAQQDAFLPHVEDGTLTFIGATTENPSFEIVGALLSRARVYVLEGPERRGVAAPAADARSRTGARPRRAGAYVSKSAALELLARAGDGDARRALNMLELAAGWPSASGGVQSSAPRWRRRSPAAAAAASTRAASSSTTRSQRCTRRCAAPIRTRRCTGWRACSTAAAIRTTWLAALPAWPARTSDSPIRARCRSRWTHGRAYERLGSPEGELALAEAVVYLAVAAKSNAVYSAWGEARKDVEALWLARSAAAIAQCADSPDEGSWLWQRLSLRTR